MEGTKKKGRRISLRVVATIKTKDASHQLRSLRVRFFEPHVLGNPPVWLHNGTYREL